MPDKYLQRAIAGRDVNEIGALPLARSILNNSWSTLEEIREACEGLAAMYKIMGPHTGLQVNAAHSAARGWGRNTDVQKTLIEECGAVGEAAATTLVRLEGPV